MKLSNGALVAVVDGEKLALFKNTNASDIKLTPLETPAIADRVSGSAGRRSNEANPDNDTQAEDGFAMGVAEVLNKWSVTNKIDELLVIAAPRRWANCASIGTRTFKASWSARSPRT